MSEGDAASDAFVAVGRMTPSLPVRVDPDLIRFGSKVAAVLALSSGRAESNVDEVDAVKAARGAPTLLS